MVNKVILIGNVGMDPEIRTLEGGTKMARLRVATTERIYNRQTQETREHTEWHTVMLWRGDLAVWPIDMSARGVRFISREASGPVSGRTKDNNKRYSTEIVANDMRLLGRRAENAGMPMDGTTYGAAPRPQAAAPAATIQQPSGSMGTAAPEDEVDDLPF